MSNLRIEEYLSDMNGQIIQFMSKAFVTNPLHIAVFGENQLQKNEVFVRNLMKIIKGSKYVAMDANRIVGFIHWVDSSNCQLSGLGKAKALPGFLLRLGIPTSLRLLKWLSIWEKHDPDEKHSHLGPIGVRPTSQGKGIGGLLMKKYCEELNKTGVVGYLETDRPENVKFYSRYGFQTTHELSILSITNYLMRREV